MDCKGKGYGYIGLLERMNMGKAIKDGTFERICGHALVGVVAIVIICVWNRKI